MKLILKVEESFEIEGRGLVIVQKIYPKLSQESQLSINDKVLIDNGVNKIETFIKSIEMLLMRPKPEYTPLGIPSRFV